MRTAAEHRGRWFRAALVLSIAFGMTTLPFLATLVTGAPPLAAGEIPKRATLVGAAQPAGPIALADLPSCTNQYLDGGPECAGAQMVYDEVDHDVLAQMMCINTTAPLLFISCTWAYQNGTWSPLASPSGGQPPALLQAGFVWDGADGYAALFGGVAYPQGHPMTSTWVYRAGMWTNLTSAPSFGLRNVPFVRAAYDSTDHYVVATYQFSFPDGGWDTFVYSYAAGSWTNLTSTLVAAPDFPFVPVAADDPTDRGAIFFGGFTNISQDAAANVTWLYSAGSWRESGGPSTPPSLFYPSITYDSVDGYVLLVGGLLRGCGANPCLLSSSVWALDHGQWKNLTAKMEGDVPREWQGSVTTDVAVGAVIEGFGAFGYTGSGINQLLEEQSHLYSYSNYTWSEEPNPSTSSPTPWTSLGEVAIVVAAAGGAGVLVFLLRRRRGPT